MNETFSKNLKALKNKDINLADSVEKSSDIQLSCYDEPVAAKTGDFVPVLKDKKALFSVYNPARDSDNFLKDIDFAQKQFIVIAGLANGLHLKKALNNSNIHFLIVEKNAESISTLFNQFDLCDFLNADNFSFCTTSTLEETFSNLYIPQLNGNFSYLSLRPWAQFNIEAEHEIHAVLKRCLDKISADYSVQAHFAKIWQRNIMRNLKTMSTCIADSGKLPSEKTAAIIGAGPSLDQDIESIQKRRNNLFIIATDTAWRIMLNYNIVADAVLTIDGQNISYRHFIDKFPDRETLFVVDLCAHPAIAEKAQKNGNKLQFIASNHPLCSLAKMYAEKQGEYFPPSIDTTSGTVTIAAVDFAVKSGFKEIEIYGADFAYTNSKAYAKGSYLDPTFENDSTRINTKETAFNALMFRTPVIQKGNNTVTTEVLERYALALQKYFENCPYNLKVSKSISNNLIDIYKNSSSSDCKFVPIFFSKTLYKSFNFADFKTWLLHSFKNYDKNHESAVTSSLLPLAAWCERMGLYKSSSGSLSAVAEYACKLADK